LEFIDGENVGKKKKSGDKLIEKNKKNNAKSDINKDDKIRKKKEKKFRKRQFEQTISEQKAFS